MQQDLEGSYNNIETLEFLIDFSNNSELRLEVMSNNIKLFTELWNIGIPIVQQNPANMLVFDKWVHSINMNMIEVLMIGSLSTYYNC